MTRSDRSISEDALPYAPHSAHSIRKAYIDDWEPFTCVCRLRNERACAG